MTIIWCIVPEIRSTTDRIFCYSGLFFAIITALNILKKWKQTWRYYHFTNVCHKWQSHHVWFLKYGVQRTTLFVILDRFLPFYPPNNLKNQNFKKMKKTPSDIIIFHRCTINDNHMMYGSWDTEHRRQAEFLVILDHYLPFYPPKNLKIKVLRKIYKMPRDIIILYMCTINDNHILYGSWDTKCDGQNFFSFLTSCALLPP